MLRGLNGQLIKTKDIGTQVAVAPNIALMKVFFGSITFQKKTDPLGGTGSVADGEHLIQLASQGESKLAACVKSPDSVSSV